MNCPVCTTPLNMMERQGVEIDYCPQCRGVWLDRGELDKIIERSATGATGVANNPAPPNQSTGYTQPPPYPNTQTGYSQPQYPPPSSGYNQTPYPNTHYGQPHYKKKKHESFLGELFDFD